jgi:tripartite-type tricarboxylate transporter receptor subunit TctC
MKARITDMGAAPFVSSPADFGKLVAGEADKWAKVIKFAGVRPD